MGEPVNILLTSVGRRVSLMEAFRRALKDLGVEGKVYGADRSSMAPGFQVADEGFLVPAVAGPDYVEALLEVCRRRRIALLIPLIDWELAAIAEARDRFAAVGTRAVVSGRRVIETCRDKRKTFEFLKGCGLETPNLYSYEDALAQPFPLFIKPRFGSSAKDVHHLADREALEFYHRRGVESVIQDYVQGKEFTVDVYAGFDGVPRIAVPRQRLEVRGGEVAKARTVRHEGVIRSSLRLVEALGECAGVVTIQCFVGVKDDIKFIEINPRFGGGVPLSIRAGADFPRWLIGEHQGKKPAIDGGGWEEDLVMLRYDAEVFRRWGDFADEV
jgi:carbamoyl-phosphate synthase large subunit